MAKFSLTQKANRERGAEVYALLHEEYPDAKCSLTHKTSLQLLIATILSAQCTDDRVNKVTPELFKKFRNAHEFATKPRQQLEKAIQSCGFYRAKAKNIAKCCQKIVEQHGGEVPQTLEELVGLDGVGRKTANVLLGTWYGIPGIVVDTHCGRINRRLGFTKNDDPVKIEHDIMKILPSEIWTDYSMIMVHHGRALCQSRKPKCSQCPIRELCPFPDTREGKRIAQ